MKPVVFFFIYFLLGSIIDSLSPQKIKNKNILSSNQLLLLWFHSRWELRDMFPTGWWSCTLPGLLLVLMNLPLLCDRKISYRKTPLKSAGCRKKDGMNEDLRGGAGGGWAVGVGIRGRRRKRPRMYPRPSCSVSYTALVPLRKKREAEQINTGRRIPSISFTSLPTWIKGWRGGVRSVSTQVGGNTRGRIY